MAAAAEAQGQDIHRPPLNLDGRQEVSQAAQAFNAMQQRLITMVNDKACFLAAVSHDLRTPLTRMRLRLERLPDDEQRERLRQNITQMDNMIVQVLDYLRAGEQQNRQIQSAMDRFEASVIMATKQFEMKIEEMRFAAEEREHQRKDALSSFPCTALLHAGRQLLQAWKTESAAIRHAAQVCGMLEADLKEHEECLDSSGRLSKKKDELVADLQAARSLHDEKVEALETISLAMKKGNQDRIRNRAKEFGLQDVPTDKLMNRLRQDVKEASGGLTDAMTALWIMAKLQAALRCLAKR
jgi:hypothetical protein